MTVLRPGLADSLKTLKLSGMLETLDARLAQAHGGDLGHLEFLQILCDDEIARREAQSMARRLRRARFETAATLEGFDFTASPKLPAVQIRDLAALRWLHAGESVLVYGPVVINGSCLCLLNVNDGCNGSDCRSLLHCYQGEFNDEMERQRWLLLLLSGRAPGHVHGL